MAAKSDHLKRLEAEAMYIFREAMSAQNHKPVLLYSMGKDSTVLLHLAKKAFSGVLPFPVLHVDTGWKFNDMIAFRNQQSNLNMVVHTNHKGQADGVSPLTHAADYYTQVMKTEALREALTRHQFTMVFGGARRDEEKSRAKERIVSHRDQNQSWDPKNQRPELWGLYNFRINTGESLRVFPLSNWTELDIWEYIAAEGIDVVPLYFAAMREGVCRNGQFIVRDDDRLVLNPDEAWEMRQVRFRTLGCYPLTAAIESDAATVEDIIKEIKFANQSERSGRLIDGHGAASMEMKKREGYF